MKRKFLNILSLSIFTTAVLGFSGCTKYFDPEPKYEEYEQEEDLSVKRKVLLISIDGLVGEELKKDVPEYIAELMKSSKYSFAGLTDENTSDPSSWTTMMTGYSSDKHRVFDDSFLPAPKSDDPHSANNFAPSFIYRLEDQQSSLRTSVITQDDGVANVLLMDADDNLLVKGDDKVKEEAVKLLEKSAPDLLVLQFKDVLKAGVTSGFSADETDYAEAIKRVDGYIKEVVTALKSRETADLENWLVILTSSHGGDGKSYGGESFPERNIFSLYHQVYLSGDELIPELIVSPNFYGYDGAGMAGVRARNGSQAIGEEHYNIAKTGEFTVEAKIKVNRNASGNFSYSWPPFLSKINARTGQTPGWSFFRNGNNVSFFCADGIKGIEITAGPISIDDTWTHISATVKKIDGKVVATFYVNGTKAAEKSDALNMANITSTSPLTFGFQPEVFSSAYLDCHLSDVHIWNKALSDDEVRVNANRIGLSEEESKSENLKGFWPMDDGGPILKNMVMGMPDMPLQGDYQYKVLANNLPYVDDKAILVQNIDIASNVFYWLGITPQDNWALEGKAFLSTFELEFLR